MEELIKWVTKQREYAVTEKIYYQALCNGYQAQYFHGFGIAMQMVLDKIRPEENETLPWEE